ncbi:hypothetical protein [Roseomonas sp. BN140053]|uniref:hypothetical protein n=1 Tax=Roseomonas sp. BN140053 TaxID=3391898 RepID=UPI0039EC071D
MLPLRSDLSLNPAVLAAAELFTDGALTDTVLANVAAMRGLPLHVTLAPAAAPDAAALAAKALQAAEAALRDAVRCWNGARLTLGEANRTSLPPLARGLPRRPVDAETRRRLQADAMRGINRRRAQLRAAQRALDVARTAFAAVAS